MTQLDEKYDHLLHYSLVYIEPRTSCQTLSITFDNFKKIPRPSNEELAFKTLKTLELLKYLE